MIELNIISIVISFFAFATSAYTIYMTLLRKGKVKATKPTVIFFGYEKSSDNHIMPKIFLRTLIFSTAKRGHVIENMYLKVIRNETIQNFNIWVYGETNNLVRGSGIFVGDTGVIMNHHFLPPKDATDFRFLIGTYELQLFVSILGKKNPINLCSLSLNISSEQARTMTDYDYGLFFDWGPDSKEYYSHIDYRKEKPNPLLDTLLEFNEIKRSQDPLG